MPRSFRLPLAPRLLSLFAVALIGIVSVGMFGLVVAVLMAKQWLVAVVVAASAAVLMVLTHYVARDLAGKWSLRIVLNHDSVNLSLPKNRSLIHKTASLRAIIPYQDIAAIETRLEGYTTFGTAFLQRPYVLRRTNGDAIYLFEERAIGTGMESAYFPGLVAELAARADVPVRDLGMSEGGGGVLGVWGTHEADWAAPALPVSRQMRLLRKAGFTGALAFLVLNLGFVVEALIRLLR